MAETPTQAAIVNMALALLGSSQRIASLDEGTTIAAQAKAIWSLALREVLADHPWNFAIERAELNEAGTAPAFGWDNAFTLPADCLRWLPPGEDEDDYFEAVQEGDRLLTNESAPLLVRYISLQRGEPINRWSPHFATAMGAKLAMLLAETVTQSESVSAAAEDRALRALNRAKRMDALSGGQKRGKSVTVRSRWVQAGRRAYNRDSM